MWIARNKNGELRLFDKKPTRKMNDVIDMPGEIHGEWFVEKTLYGHIVYYVDNSDYGIPTSFDIDLRWEDEPIEIEIASVVKIENGTQF